MKKQVSLAALLAIVSIAGLGFCGCGEAPPPEMEVAPTSTAAGTMAGATTSPEVAAAYKGQGGALGLPSTAPMPKRPENSR